MKKLLLGILLSASMTGCIFAQSGGINVQKYSDGTSDLKEAFNVRSGTVIEFRSGSTLQLDAGSMFTFPPGGIPWSALTGIPTSLAGMGITNGSALDALGAVAVNGILSRTGPSQYATATTTGAGNVVLSASPTITGTLGAASETLSGTLGVTGAITGATFNGLTLSSSTGTLGIANGKTDVFSNSLTFAGVDGSTLNIGAGGTLGTNAFNSTAYQTPQTSAAAYGIINGAQIDAWGLKAIPVGTVVGTTDTQTLTGKTISGGSNTLSNIGNGSLTNPSFTLGSTSISLGATQTSLAGLALTGSTVNGLTVSTSTGTLTIANGKTLTAANSLSFAGPDGATETFQASDTIVGRATTDTLTNKSISGSTNTLTAIGNASLSNSSVTIGSSPVSLGGTLSTIAGLTLTAPALGVATATSINGLSITSSTGTLTIANGKTGVFSNSLTFAGPDNATETFQATDTIVGRSTSDTLTNKGISGTTNTLTNIGNGSLTNSSFTIGSTSIPLGGTASTIAGLVLTAPSLGVATATSINGNAITAGTGTLTLGTATLNAGAGGTLGSNAFTSTTFAPLNNPTFTGTVTTPVTITMGSAVLNAGTGGTLGSNAFTSTTFAPVASPTFTGTVTTNNLTVNGTFLAPGGGTVTGNIEFAPTSGNTLFVAPTGSQAAKMFGAANELTLWVINNQVAGSSFGINVEAGGNTSDWSQRWYGSNGSPFYGGMRGDGLFTWSGNESIGGNLVVTGSTQVGTAYAAGVTTATGTIDILDSTGTTYHVLVHN